MIYLELSSTYNLIEAFLLLMVQQTKLYARIVPIKKSSLVI